MQRPVAKQKASTSTSTRRIGKSRSLLTNGHRRLPTSAPISKAIARMGLVTGFYEAAA
jgi:hypothetical protein